jgi:mono/diheme cytochrome c family protein
LGAILATAGCGKPLPTMYPSSRYTNGEITTNHAADDAKVPFAVPPVVQARIDRAVNEAYPAPWIWSAEERSKDERRGTLAQGHQLYQRHCVHCHGMSGDGRGPTADSLNPVPRDFRRGIFKWKSTAGKSKPTHDDLVRTLKFGAVGTSMPPFILLPNDELNTLAQYVTYLSQRGEFEWNLLVRYSEELWTEEEILEAVQKKEEDVVAEVVEEVAERIDETWADAADDVVEAEDVDLAEPGSSEFEDSVTRGRELFLGPALGCTKCHGQDGRSVAKLSSADSLDAWGRINPPRDLTLGLYRGGNRPIDLYRRIHEGIAGSSMPSQSSNKNVTKAELWDVVQFLRALPHRPELLAPPLVDAAGRSPAHSVP